MQKESKSSDLRYIEALRSISNIALRPWPEGQPLYTFSDSFETDVRNIKKLCARRNVFAWTSEYFVKKYDIVNYLNGPIFLFYLPAVLLAVLRYPKSSLATILLIGQFERNRHQFSEAEQKAVDQVIEFMEGRGVAVDEIRSRVERTRVQRRLQKEKNAMPENLREG